MTEEKKISGLGITRDELKTYLKGRMEQNDMRPLLVKELYSRDDGDYSLVTETPPAMVHTKLRMRMIEHAMNFTRTKSLISCFIEDFNREMIAVNRKGRLELLGGLQMLSSEDEGGERAVNLGGR